MELVAIPPDQVDLIWPLVAPFIEKVAGRDGRTCPNAVKENVTTGDQQLWAVWDGDKTVAAFVTEMRIYPARKTLALVLLGADDRMAWWARLSPLIFDWARDEGCDSVEFWGRKGWIRALPDFEIESYLMVKKL